jgi:hypothetical protein
VADVRAITIETDDFSDTSEAHNAWNGHSINRRIGVMAEDRENFIWLSDIDN